MMATVDISLYPLQDQYKETIIAFVKSLRLRKELSIHTDSMSTQLIGEYDVLMSILQTEMKAVLEKTSAVFIIKLAKGERSLANLTPALR